MSLVSIIICIYNGEKYIDQCLSSILAQTYSNIEVIVVNDGSTDGTKQILSEYKNIIHIDQENQGISAARAVGISHAKGEYITYLDIDDLYLPNKIEEQVVFLENNPQYDIVYNDCIIIDEQNNEISKIRSDYPQMYPQDFLAQLLFRQVIPCPASMMFRRRCFEEVNYPKDLRHSEDYYMTIQQAQKFAFGYLPKILYKYRKHTSNLTSNRIGQEEAEIQIVRNLGSSQIKNIINQSTLSHSDKKMLLAKIFIKIREYKHAIDVLNGLNEELSLKYFYMGNASYLLEDYNEACRYYEKSIKLEERAECYNNYGAVWYQLEDIEQAQEFFRKAEMIRPMYLDAKLNIKGIKGKNYIPKITIRELRTHLMVY